MRRVEAMDVSQDEGGDQEKGETVILSSHLFGDVDAYMARYASVPIWSRCRRLLSVGKLSANESQRMACFAACAREAKHGLDTATYKAACELGGESVDEAWVEATDERYRATHERLEGELASKRSSGAAKENVWEAYGRMGDWLALRGEMSQALKCYVRMRDYASGAARSLEVCCVVASAAVEVGSWANVANFAAKAEMIEGLSSDTVRWARLKVAGGLAHMEAGQYDLAARWFIDVLCSSAHELPAEADSARGGTCSWRDVALYGSACAVASFPRSDLRSRCADNVRFKKAVGLYHPDALAMVLATQACQYSRALELSAALREELRLDPIVRHRADLLYELVADRCIAQFCAPYAAVSLDAAAAKFVVFDPKDLEQRVVNLIYKGHIKAKIDSKHRAIVACEPDARRAAFDTILQKGEAYIRECHGLLLRMSCLENDFIVRPPQPASNNASGAPAPSSRTQTVLDSRRNSGSHRLRRRAQARGEDRFAFDDYDDDYDDDDIIVQPGSMRDDLPLDSIDNDQELDNLEISTSDTAREFR